MPAQPIDPVSLQRRLDTVTSRIDGIENSAIDLIKRGVEGVNERMDSLESDTDRAVSRLTANVGAMLEKPDGLAATLSARAYNRADQHLSNAYAQAADVGAVYPTKEKVAFYSSGGDLMQSMSFDPNNVLGTPTTPPVESIFETPTDTPLPFDVQPATPIKTSNTKGDNGELVASPIDGQPVTQTQATNQAISMAASQVAFGGVPSCNTWPILWRGSTSTDTITTWCPECVFYTPYSDSEALSIINEGASLFPDVAWSRVEMYRHYVEGDFLDFGQTLVSFAFLGSNNVPVLQRFYYQAGRSPVAWRDKSGRVRFAAFPPDALPPKNPYCDGGQVTPPPPPPPVDPTPPPPVTTATSACGTQSHKTPNLKATEHICRAFESMVGQGTSGWQMSDWLALNKALDSSQALKDVPVIGPLLGLLVGLPHNTVTRFVCWLEDIVKSATEKTDCNAAKLVPLAILNASIELVEKWTGAMPPAVVANVHQAMNTVCQYLFPSQAEVDHLYATRKIDKPTWECYTKANGNHVSPREPILDMMRTRPDAAQITMLRRRDQIKDDEYERLIKELGVVEQEDKDNFKKLQLEFPHLDDVIRFMVRDVADEEAVKKFGYDDDFENKWKDPLKKYGDYLGVTDDMAKLYWRAHWRLPSPTQLYEMYHRLRPGRVEKDVETTKEDIEKALQMDDLLPYWVKRNMAVSFRRLTRVDARRAYEVDAMDDTEFMEQLLDLGYQKSDAEKLFTFFKIEKERKLKAKMGFPPPAFWTKQYIAMNITQDEYEEALYDLDIPQETVNRMVDFGQTQRRFNAREQIIKTTKQQFVAGLISEDEARSRMANEGIPSELVGELLPTWYRVVKIRKKEIPAATLCKWRSLNVITPGQQTQALIRLGYSTEDARRIVQACQFELDQKQQKELERALEKAKREAEKRAKEEEKRRKEAEKNGQFLPT